MTADAIEREVIAGPVEGTVAGNIGVQAIAAGEVSDINRWRRIIGNTFPTKTYLPNNVVYFDDNLSKYLGVIKG